MNPFNEKPRSIEKTIQNWQQLYPKPYNKREVDPYTKTRIILMNGTEFESNWFSHQFARHVDDNDLRRDLALTRYIENDTMKFHRVRGGQKCFYEKTKKVVDNETCT